MLDVYGEVHVGTCCKTPPKRVPAYPRLHLSAASLALVCWIFLLAVFVEIARASRPRKEREGLIAE